MDFSAPPARTVAAPTVGEFGVAESENAMSLRTKALDLRASIDQLKAEREDWKAVKKDRRADAPAKAEADRIVKMYDDKIRMAERDEGALSLRADHAERRESQQAAMAKTEEQRAYSESREEEKQRLAEQRSADKATAALQMEVAKTDAEAAGEAAGLATRYGLTDEQRDQVRVMLRQGAKIEDIRAKFAAADTETPDKKAAATLNTMFEEAGKRKPRQFPDYESVGTSTLVSALRSPEGALAPQVRELVEDEYIQREVKRLVGAEPAASRGPAYTSGGYVPPGYQTQDPVQVIREAMDKTKTPWHEWSEADKRRLFTAKGFRLSEGS